MLVLNAIENVTSFLNCIFLDEYLVFLGIPERIKKK